MSHALDGKVEDTDKPKTLSEPPKLTAPPPPLQTSITANNETTNERRESLTQNDQNNLSIVEIETILNEKVELCKQNNLSVTMP